MRTYAFKGKLLKLARVKKKLPTGRAASLEVIEHPGAALIVPFLTKEKILLLRQYRPVIGKYLYELPAGTLDAREAPPACAKREVIEETGFGAKKMTKLGMIYPVPGYSTEIIHIFKAEGLYPAEAAMDADEVITSKAYSLTAVRRLFQQGKIQDAKTIAALAMAKLL